MTNEEIREIISKYNIVLHIDGKTLIVHRMKDVNKDKMLQFIKDHKPEILAYLVNEKNERIAKEQDRQNRIDAIPGLKEITKAQDELMAWRRAFERSFEGENACDGFGVGPKPEYDIEAMKAQYPIAAAYLKAFDQYNKANYELSAIGKKAMETIIYHPDQYEAAIQQMEVELKQFDEKHIFD